MTHVATGINLAWYFGIPFLGGCAWKWQALLTKTWLELISVICVAAKYLGFANHLEGLVFLHLRDDDAIFPPVHLLIQRGISKRTTPDLLPGRPIRTIELPRFLRVPSCGNHYCWCCGNPESAPPGTYKKNCKYGINYQPQLVSRIYSINRTYLVVKIQGTGPKR